MIRPKVPGFKLEAKIGNGTFAEVYKAKRYNGDEQFVAIKCIKKGELSASTVNSIITEIKALKLLRHPHIIQMLDFVWDDNFIYIIMEYCEGGDLSVFIKTYHHLKENICKLFLSQLASAIKYLRQHNIVHMDLKPQNLLLSSRKHPLLKLSDFGLAQFLQNREKETSLRGSPLYMAPEILLQQSYDASVDLWSTGIILYECIFGKPPYTSKSLGDLVGKIKSDVPVTIPTNIAISAECRDLLTKLLVKDSSGRLSFDDFFKHPFVHQPNNQRQHQQSSMLEHLRNSAGENGSTARPIDSSSTRPSNEITQRCYPPFHELHSLASATPSMASALEIGIEGVQYDAEGQLTLALERYTAALEIMIPLLRRELKGRRKELLHQQVTLWMKRAEEIRVQLDQQDSDCQELLSLGEDAGYYCTMQ